MVLMMVVMKVVVAIAQGVVVLVIVQGMVVVAVVATSFNCGGGNLKSNGGCMRMVMLVEFIEFHIFL
jgi:hypothetical protein